MSSTLKIISRGKKENDHVLKEGLFLWTKKMQVISRRGGQDEGYNRRWKNAGRTEVGVINSDGAVRKGFPEEQTERPL